MKELRGEIIPYAGGQIYACTVTKYSFLGRFIIDRLERVHYPVKKIDTFNFFMQINVSTRRHYIPEGNFYKIEKLSQSYVMLPEKYVDEVNDFFEQHFRSAFYNYIRYSLDNELQITQSILNFIDHYELFECGVTQEQLRKLYYRIRENGLFYSIQDRKRSTGKTS